MSNAFDNQVDGDHYTKMAMQPIELAYLVGGTPCFCKLAKYATRIKGERQINLDKAIHCIELERTLINARMSKETLDVLFHMLNHSNYHRAQMALKGKEWGFKIPSFQFVVFR